MFSVMYLIASNFHASLSFSPYTSVGPILWCVRLWCYIFHCIMRGLSKWKWPVPKWDAASPSRQRIASCEWRDPEREKMTGTRAIRSQRKMETEKCIQRNNSGHDNNNMTVFLLPFVCSVRCVSCFFFYFILYSYAIRHKKVYFSSSFVSTIWGFQRHFILFLYISRFGSFSGSYSCVPACMRDARMHACENETEEKIELTLMTV